MYSYALVLWHISVQVMEKLLNGALCFLLLVSFLESLQKLLIVAYEPLDTPAGRDLCYSCVEFPFFKPLWPMLLAVLR